MKRVCLLIAIFYSVSSFSQSKWKLVWKDEFNYTGMPSAKKWQFDTAGNKSGWGNNEAQWYSSNNKANAIVNNGTLKITAIKEEIRGKKYSSARLYTKGIKDWKYGKIEVKAKLPSGKGTWPAIWMLGSSIENVDWPLCGEIDIMEHVGYMKDSVFGTIHSASYNHMKGTQKGKGILINNPYTQFHTYSIEWTPQKIDFFVDGQLYNHIVNEHLTNKEWPFDQPFFLILNLAVGGNWGGKYGIDDSVFPAVMEVDFVRIYQKKVY